MNRFHGYTVVELVVTIALASMLTLSIFQLVSVANNLASDTSRRYTASNIAYNNMRKYANYKKPLWFECIGDDSGETTPPFSDGKTKPGATGQVLLNMTSSESVEQLPPPVVQSVVAVAPYGCGVSGPGQPIRVQSQITYGSGLFNRTVTHATYVSY